MITLMVGDKVKYSEKFLHSIFAYNDKAMRNAWGIIMEIEDLGGELKLAVITWNTANIPNKVNVKNLRRKG